jgi:Trk-type K+ transport system membrane component
MKDEKLTPRITETAKNLWYIYVGLNFACFLAYWLSGDESVRRDLLQFHHDCAGRD